MASFLSTLFGGGAEAEAADKNRALLQQAQTQGTGYLDTGYNAGTGYLKQGISAYDPLSALGTKYNAAGDLYLGALGAGGPQGTAAAQSAFTNAPGYQAGVDAGLTGINRRRALGGMADSGNADVDALNYAQNAQNTQYNNWLQNLQNAGATGANITGNVAAGQAGGYGSLANLSNQYATNQVGLLNTTTSGMEAANTAQAAGEAAGAKNLLGAGLSIAGMVAGGPMGAGLGSALGSGAGSLVSGFGSGLANSPFGTSAWGAANPGAYGSAYYGPSR